jgi:hypothetical protein
VLGQVPLRGSASSLTVVPARAGVHFYSARYQRTLTPPLAVTVGMAAPALTLTNQHHTVVVGRTAACDQVARTPVQAGCEAVSSRWLPNAVVTITLSYPDGTSQTFRGRADGKGQIQHVFAVGYQPPRSGKVGALATRSWIAVAATNADGTLVKSACIRFAVLPKS